MAESEKARKKRLAKQSKDAKAGRKPSNKKAQDAVKKEIAATRSTDDTTINKMLELGLPIPEATRPEPKPRKKAAEKPKPEGPAEAPVVDAAPKSGEDWKREGAEKNPAFEEVQKERDVNEIGGLGAEATVPEKQARDAKLAKYSGQIREINDSTVPRNEVDTTEDPLRPRVTEEDPTPTPAQAAARSSRTASGGSGTGIYTFDSPRPAETPQQNVSVLQSRRQAKGLPGLPGDQNGVNDLALGLAKRDYAIAKTTNKTVNEMDPEGDEPSHIDQIYYGHHRRLAEVMLVGGLTEDHIAKSAQGSGRNTVAKVKYLHSLLKKHESARDARPINLESEGITHWIHPTTGVAHPIADNHPDMPKMQPQQVEGGDKVGHGFWRGGKEERVRKDASTGSYVVDKNTGNAEVDASLGWNPDKEVGFYTVNLRGGIKALKQNIPPASGRSLWEHEVNNMKNEFPASVSVDSRLQHKAYANRILLDASKSEVDGRVLARNRAGEPIPKINRKTGKLAGMIRSSGRTVNRGFTVSGVDENGEGGEATQTTGIATSRARVTREGAPFPTKELGDSGYAEGGSTLVERTTTMPERVKVGEFQNKKRRTKKKAVVNGKTVVIPPERGLLVTQAPERDMFAPSTTPTPPSKQFSSIFDSTGPAPSWDRPNVMPVNEPGVSTAEPITKGKVTFTKTVMPDPKAAKKNPKTKKTITKYEKHVGMVDQMLPGFEKLGVKEPSNPFDTPEPKFKIVEGPITAAQQAGEDAVPNPTSNVLKRHKGKVVYSEPKETPIAAPQNTVSLQLAKIAGNTPVEQPVAAEPEGPAKTVLSYRQNKMVAPASAPVKAASPKAKAKVTEGDAPTDAPEQLALPGMEPPSHSGGQQWLRTRNLSPQTRELQGRSSRAGVPGGANPINVVRGTEAPKSNRSFKK
jgi:hypothetical protein